MKLRITLRVLALAGLLAGDAAAVDTAATRLLAEPALSESLVAFVYDADLWVAPRRGPGAGVARRLTTAEGAESNPAFSPDGVLIAFTGNYDGNRDVYVMPAAGGVPERLTWHPGADVVRGFTPDGRVLFQSSRSVHTRRYSQLFTVDVSGGPPQRLPVPYGTKASLSPDGRRIAYVPIGERFQQWKNYRGGTTSRLWLMDLEGYAVQEVPRPPERSNDTDPMWVGDRLYFNSDRAGEFNLFSFDPESGAVEQLTHHDGFPVIAPSAGPGAIVYEQAGRLHLLDLATRRSEPLVIGVAADLREARARYASGAEWVRSASLSPGGERVALGYRGEIVTLPAGKGDARNLSRSPGAHDRSPAWSPDGARIAWLSDASGEYALHVAAQDGAGATRRIELSGAGYYEDLHWSPDGRYVSLRDNALAIWVVEIETGRATEVAREPVYTPVVTTRAAWSPDSRWLAYTLAPQGLVQSVYLYSLETGESHRVTDGLAEAAEPVFDPDGRYLYLLGSTDAGAVKDWFAQSNTDRPVSYRVYAVALAADAPSPIPPQSDEVGSKAESMEEAEEPEAATPPEVRVDLAGLERRILALPVGDDANRRSLQVGGAGELYYLEERGSTGFGVWQGPATLKRFTLEKREAETLGEAIDAYEVSRDGKKLLTLAQGSWALRDAGPLEAGAGALPLDRVSVRVEPRAEWQQIFREVWRINRDYFYATNFHGADWDAIGGKYAPLVEHAATRADLERLLVWMSSELAVGHSYSGSGETIQEPPDVPVGLLGADLELADGRHRFSKIYGGLHWTPGLEAPLAKPGVSVSEGEYLLAVDGQELTASQNPLRYLENGVGRQVTLRVGPRADGEGARDVVVEPIADEAGLRLRDWIDGNLRKVDAATDGRVAYVYVPDTADEGHASFKRYFYPQSHKQAIIVDERYNGGGLVADYYIDLLRRPYVSHWAMRYGADLVTPRGAIFGPRVMIIDETAGSGGDLLPWMFRKFELGTLVGKRTWGGLVGILGYPELMDGGSITAPNLAIWTADGWVVENEGVPPDVEVEQWPAEVNAGHDPQLERAIELALEALEADPPRQPTRPPFPVRARRPSPGGAQ